MKVFVWGTGGAAREFTSIAKINDIEIVAYTDNDCTKWSKDFDGKPVVSTGDVCSYKFDKIVICSTYHEFIKRQIERCIPRIAKDILIYTKGYFGELAVLDKFRIPYELMKWKILQFAVLSKCNLFCSHCLRDKELAKTDFEMPLSEYQGVLSRFDPAKFDELCVSEFGEITLLKQYQQFYDTLANKGWINIQFVTNGTCTNVGYFEHLFKLNIMSKVIISLEATDEALFKAIRGYPFERFKKFVEMISDLREKYCSKAEFHISACCMRKNLLEMPRIVEFAGDNGFTHVGFVPLVVEKRAESIPGKLNVTSQALENIDVNLRNRVYAETMEAVRRKRIQACLPEPPSDSQDFVNRNFTRDNGQFICTLPYDYVSVSRSGGIYPCCKMAKKHPLGNVFEDSFESIWNGPGYEALFKSLRPGAKLLKNCVGCTVTSGYSW